jgi:lipoprotein-anchoring transpeptidase ErfK/SrfK
VLITVLLSVLVAALVLVGIGFGVVRYFEHHVLPGTELAGESIGGYSEEQVHDLVVTLVDNYQPTLQFDDQDKQATAAQLGVTFDVDATVAAAMSAGRDLPKVEQLNPWKSKKTQLVSSVDQDKLQTWLDKTFITADMRQQSAGISFDADQQSFVVDPAVPGEVADGAAVADELLANAAGSQPVRVVTKAEAPIIDDATAQTQADAINAAVNLPYKLTAGKAEYTIPPALLASWLTVKADEATGGFITTVDEAKAQTELPSLLAENLTKAAVPKQIMHGPSGVVFGTSQSGADGTAVADPAAVVSQVVAALQAGQGLDATVDVTVDPAPTEEVGMPAEYLVPGGARWIEVNRSNHTATRWEGTTALSTWTVVIGKPSTPTTAGVFHVWHKNALQDMTDGATPETRTYLTKDVPWSAYFNGDQALHGNYWGVMGTSSSHGCVGMPPDLAKVNYDWIQLGDLVVVHD